MQLQLWGTGRRKEQIENLGVFRDNTSRALCWIIFAIFLLKFLKLSLFLLSSSGFFLFSLGGARKKMLQGEDEVSSLTLPAPLLLFVSYECKPMGRKDPLLQF